MTRFRRPRKGLAIALVLWGLTGATTDPARADASGDDAAVALGVVALPADAARLVDLQRPADTSGPWVWLAADRAALESAAEPDAWSALEEAVAGLHRAGFRIALALTDDAAARAAVLPTPATPGSLESWLEFARGAVRRLGAQVEVYGVWDISGAPAASLPDPRDYAFLLKQTALALRAEAGARGLEIRIAQVSLPVAVLDWQEDLWSRDVAPYFDILPVLVDETTSTSEIERVRRASLGRPPAPSLWVRVGGNAGEGSWRAVQQATLSFSAGASVALVPAGSDSPSGDPVEPWVFGVHELLATGFAPAPAGQIALEAAAGGPLEGGRVLGRFLRQEDFTSAVVFLAPAVEGEVERAQLILDSSPVREIRILDAASGGARRTGSTALPGGRPGQSVAVPRGPVPQVVLFRRQIATPGLELPTEEVEISSSRGLTAEEIIARYQEVQRQQDDKLERWTARGRVDFHFKLATSGSGVDVSIDSNYFWERGGDLEWEQTDYYVNGNKVRWKNIPELPLIQPEKVITLPLDLTLDKTYAYRLVGQDSVGGRGAYVLEFQPADPNAALNLYRGRVWIDRDSFVRLKASVIQSDLEAPVLSNEEVDRFEPQAGADGTIYWLLTSISGQQTWKAAGRTFVVQRELTFHEFQLNPEAESFGAERERAYASTHQMLRDTEGGFRYLEREVDGSRTERVGVDTSQLFAAGGAFKDNSTDGVTPLGGVNYFNYDLWGRKIQVNALFAGVLGFFTASKPDLAGGRLDATLDATLSAIKFEDKVFEADEEIEAERLESRTQRVALRLGFPLGQFLKLNLVGDVGLRGYFDNDEAQDAIDSFNLANARALTFILPEDHVEIGGSLEVEFNRKGYGLNASYRRASRSDWEPWGLFDTASGQFVEFDPATGDFVATLPAPLLDSYARYGLTVGKEWFLPKFQKIRGSLSYLDGTDLDRFSQYQFSYFGEDRLNGFSGSGVRFDQGSIARVGYSFNLFEAIRFDANLDTARVEDLASDAGTQAFTGLGLNANFVGPWKTVIALGYGRALAADIADLEGEDEFLLLVLKLF